MNFYLQKMVDNAFLIDTIGILSAYLCCPEEQVHKSAKEKLIFKQKTKMYLSQLLHTQRQNHYH